MRFFVFLITVVAVPWRADVSVADDASVDLEIPVARLLFGSCIKQDEPMPIFSTMLRERADVTLFLGDNIYADTTDIAEMRAKYAKLGSNPLFQEFRSSCRCLATWDDHDYGLNDGGTEFNMRAESQQAFVDFWQDNADSIRRRRQGVYDSIMLGPPGRRVQVILLDTRYFRSPLKKGTAQVGGVYIPDDDPGKTMLGPFTVAMAGKRIEDAC